MANHSDPTTEGERVRAYYSDESIATAYLSRYAGSRGRLFHALEGSRIERLASPDGGRLLDLGCGTGRFSLPMRHSAAETFGLDVSLSMLKIAEKQRRGAGAENILFLAGDALNLPFQDESIQTVLAIGIFEYVHDLRPFLAEIYRCLSPRGQLVFTCLNTPKPFRRRHNPQGPYDTAEHTPGEVASQLGEVGLSRLAIEGEYFLLPTSWIWFVHRILRLEPVKRGWVESIILFNRLFSLLARTKLRPVLLKTCGVLLVAAKK